MLYTCTNSGCSATKIESIPKLTTHSYDGGKVVTEATCTANGVKTFTCSKCSHSYTESIAALGHKEVKDAAVAATCATTGLTEGKHCERCSIVFKAQEVIPATSHTAGEKTVITEPIDILPGLARISCITCGETLSEEEIPALGVSRVAGDVNGDGYVDIFDALLILRYDVGWDVEVDLRNADVNADGYVDIFDALLILQYDVGWDVELL